MHGITATTKWQAQTSNREQVMLMLYKPFQSNYKLFILVMNYDSLFYGLPYGWNHKMAQSKRQPIQKSRLDSDRARQNNVTGYFIQVLDPTDC